MSAPEVRSVWDGKSPKGSIIVPTRLGDENVVKRCFDGLEGLTDYPDFEVVIIVNNVHAVQIIDKHLGSRPFKVVSWEEAFNWSGVDPLPWTGRDSRRCSQISRAGEYPLTN